MKKIYILLLIIGIIVTVYVIYKHIEDSKYDGGLVPFVAGAFIGAGIYGLVKK